MKKTLGELDIFLEQITHNRFSNKKDLQKALSQFLGFSVDLQKSSEKYDDCCLISNLDLGNKDLYVDVYYLKDNHNQLYITGYEIDGEHALSEKDYDLFVLGRAR
jgi:hypothetical protein